MMLVTVGRRSVERKREEEEGELAVWQTFSSLNFWVIFLGFRGICATTATPRERGKEMNATEGAQESKWRRFLPTRIVVGKLGKGRIFASVY